MTLVVVEIDGTGMQVGRALGPLGRAVGMLMLGMLKLGGEGRFVGGLMVGTLKLGGEGRFVGMLMLGTLKLGGEGRFVGMPADRLAEMPTEPLAPTLDGRGAVGRLVGSVGSVGSVMRTVSCESVGADVGARGTVKVSTWATGTAMTAEAMPATIAKAFILRILLVILIEEFGRVAADGRVCWS